MIIKLNQVYVELTEQLLEKLKKYIQDEGENEAGGILLGGFIPLENKYVITYASEPCREDYSGASFFIRNRYSAQKIINGLWNSSEGKINYLGEWHTHGCEMPYPSFTDKKLLKTIMKDKSNVWKEVFMLIVGRKNTFYLGMTDTEAKGKIVAEVMIRGI